MRLARAPLTAGVLGRVRAPAVRWVPCCGRLLLALALCAASATSGLEAAAPRVAFRLTTQHGTPFTDHEISGRPLAIFFGYTQCPDICPTTLLQLSEDLQRLGPDADRISVLFVSLDPERDTPDVLLSYMASFDPRIVALTGAAATIAAVARAYGAHYRKVTTDQGYTIEHTAAVLLLDRDGEYVGAITYAESADAQIDDLRRLLP